MKKRLSVFLFCIACLSGLRAQVLLPNLPQVIKDTITNTVGYITAFEHDSASKKLYIAGEFVRVGNVNRIGFAVIDMTTGSVLNDLSFIELSDLSTSNHVKARLKIFKNRLYIGGAFFSTLGDYFFSINLSNNNYRTLYNLAPLSDCEIYNNKIYTSGAYYVGGNEEFDVNEMDTMGTITWTKSIAYTTSEHLSCLSARNNTLFIGGAFHSFGGNTLHNIAKVDLITHTISTWQPIPLPGPTGNSNCFDVQDLVIYPNDVLLNISDDVCGTPPNGIAGYSISNGNQNAQLRTIPFLSNSETLIADNDTSFWYNTSGLKYFGLKTYTGPWSPLSNGFIQPYFRKAGYLFIGGSFTTLEGASHKGLGIYCLAPVAPKRVSAFTKACQGQTNVLYIITPVQNATNYQWLYTGTGVTVNGTGTSVFLNFSSSATSGTFKVCAKSYCGTPSDTLYIPFTVYSPPNVNAGADIRFTCTNTIDTLLGSSSTVGATFAWYGPSYNSSSAINQVQNSINSGNYVLWVTDPLSGCKSRDTAVVTYDTLPPVLNHNLTPAELNCKTPSIILDASSLYNAGDSLHWSGNSFSQSNPALVTAAGIYTLTITSGTNDCISKDTFRVYSNYTPPNISAPPVLDTITCARDSVQLPANTSSSNTILYWNNSNNDSLPNNSYTHFSGSYVAHDLDTNNGCTSQLIRVISQFTTPPIANVPVGPFSINCSFSTVQLDGSSPNAGALLNWGGPNSFTSADPTTVTQSGFYVLSVTNPQNGCVSIDSVEVLQQNILVLNSSPDTTICNGSMASLSSSAIGGTSGFTYSWNNGGGNLQNALVSPADTTTFIVTIVDGAGCTGSDTVIVNVPSLIGDSVHTFQPCDPNNVNGQIQAYGTGGIPPYQFSLNGGGFQSSGIFSGLNYGSYLIGIKDTLGCTHGFSAVIDNSSVLPAPDFILSTSQIQGDTFVLVDISNPRPDSVSWTLPSGCTIINSNIYAPQIIHSDTGALQITLFAWFGTCEMQLTKFISVVLPDTNFANDHNSNGIAILTLYPNPNTGQFTVDITFHKKQSFAVFIFDALGNELLRVPYSKTNAANIPVNLSNAAPGSYILKIIAEYDSRNRTFLIEPH